MESASWPTKRVSIYNELCASRRDRDENSRRHGVCIQRILAEIPQRPPAERSVASWMRTEFEARDIRYTDLVMTSLPPKKRLAFSLDDTAYVTVVTLTGWGAEPRRVKQATEQSGEPAAIR